MEVAAVEAEGGLHRPWFGFAKVGKFGPDLLQSTIDHHVATTNEWTCGVVNCRHGSSSPYSRSYEERKIGRFEIHVGIANTCKPRVCARSLAG